MSEKDSLREELQKLPLRKGKWASEEQRYSEAMIQWFIAGIVPECAEGSTLRAFMSGKLHCAPMRFTKKFAGAALGKSIFSRRGQLDEEELKSFAKLELAFLHEVLNNIEEATSPATTTRRLPSGSPSKRKEIENSSNESIGSSTSANHPVVSVQSKRKLSTSTRVVTRRTSLGSNPNSQVSSSSSSSSRITLARLGKHSIHRSNSAPSLRNSPSAAWAKGVANKAAIISAKRREADLRGTTDISLFDDDDEYHYHDPASTTTSSSSSSGNHAGYIDNAEDVYASSLSLPYKYQHDPNAYNSDSGSSVHVVSDSNASPNYTHDQRSLFVDHDIDDLDNELYGWLPSDIGFGLHIPSSLEDHLGLAVPVLIPRKARPKINLTMPPSTDDTPVDIDSQDKQLEDKISKRRRTESSFLKSKPISLSTTAEGLSTLDRHEIDTTLTSFDWIPQVS